MLKRTRLSSMVATAAIAGTLLTPAPLAAQTTQVCDGKPVTITGTSGDDVLTGTSGDDVFFAAQGNDIIWGLGGDDTICAGQGNDVLIGGQGFDVLFGAQGHDVLFAADGSSASDRADSAGSRMFGGAGNDLIVGSNRWDRMQGGLGVDTLSGHEGQDWMRGGGDNDFLDGGSNTDDMHGGNGADRMRANAGDKVRGSNGNDLCALNGEPELLLSCTANDAAYNTARTLPIVPPTEAGAAQVMAYAERSLNAKSAVKFEEVFAACTDLTWLDNAGLIAEYDDVFGNTWSTKLYVLDTIFNNDRDAFFTVREVFSGNGATQYDETFELSFLYEDGAWKVDGMCF